MRLFAQGSNNFPSFRRRFKALFLYIRYSLSYLGHLTNYFLFKSSISPAKSFINLSVFQEKIPNWLNGLESNPESSDLPYQSELVKGFKALKGVCDAHSKQKCKIYYYRLQEQIENLLNDDNEESYKKWKQELNKYLKRKAEHWRLKGQTKFEIIVCRICEKKFKEDIFKEHSSECYELSAWKKDLKKKNDEITKACETAFDKKQELSVNTVLEMNKKTTIKKKGALFGRRSQTQDLSLFSFNSEEKKQQPEETSKDDSEVSKPKEDDKAVENKDSHTEESSNLSI